MSPSSFTHLEAVVRRISLSKQSMVVAAVAVALAVAFATSGQQGQQTFAVGVTNSTTTPAQGAGHPQGHLQAECGMGVWRSVPASANQQRFDCYPGGNGAAFALTYKARLADDADGNAVYHSGTVTIDCSQSSSSQGSDQPAPPATSAAFTLTGSGTGITASNVICNYATAAHDLRPPCDPSDPDYVRCLLDRRD